MVRGAPVLMVDSDPNRVELALASGELACPGCGVCWARGVRRVAGGCVAAMVCTSACVRGGAAVGRARRPMCCCRW
jgi:hypothetical protein